MKKKQFKHTKNCCNYLKIKTAWFYLKELCLKDAHRMANSVDADLIWVCTVSEEQSDLHY